MERNPYEPPRELEERRRHAQRPRKPLTGKQILFWTIAILGLPLAIGAAGSSLCFGLGSLYLQSDRRTRDLASLLICLAIAGVLACLSASIGWGWWRSFQRLRNERAGAPRDDELPPHDAAR